MQDLIVMTLIALAAGYVLAQWWGTFFGRDREHGCGRGCGGCVAASPGQPEAAQPAGRISLTLVPPQSRG